MLQSHSGLIMLQITLLFFLLFCPSFSNAALTETRWIDWDHFLINSPDELPKDSNQNSPIHWQYSSFDHNTGRSFFGSEGWFNTDPNQTTIDEEAFYIASPGDRQNSHIWFGGFGYVDIVNNFCMSGNCLRYTVTGGYSPSLDGENHCGDYNLDGTTCESYGDRIASKTQFLNFTGNPVYDGTKGDYQVGRFRWWLGNGDMSYHTPLPITTSQHNRMSYYQYFTSDATLEQFVTDGVVTESLSYPAPFNAIGGHWYHFGTQSVPNGWTHFYIDEHPSYNNSWGGFQNSPLPLGAQRTYRAQYPNEPLGYFESMYHMYSSAGRINFPLETNGLAKASTKLPAAQYMDEFMFVHDPEPQNEETINGMALTYIYNNKSFYLGFVGKYHLACNINYATYEIRYRIGSEITNANFNSSKLVSMDIPQILTGYSSPAPGVIAKNISCRQGVMAIFKLQPEDLPLLVPGLRLWIAIKDVSQGLSDDHLPNPLPGYVGRDYNSHPDLDYEYDHPAMQLIKRIPYTLGPESPSDMPTCSDNIQNGDETGIDCGGSCPPCATVISCGTSPMIQ